MTTIRPQGFAALPLRPEVLAVLAELGHVEPTPIQREALPAMLEGRDVLGQAATGTGKTAAFALPMVQLVEPKKGGPFETQALVLVPTRELAMQVAEAIGRYGKGLGVRVLALYGGQEFHHQVTPLKRGVEVVVATPGRTLDHLRRKTLKLNKVRMVVLDEADEMLDMGFAEDLEAILSNLPEKRQAALFSATLPSRIVAIAERHLNDPVRVTIVQRGSDAGTVPNIREVAYVVPKNLKVSALVRVLEVEEPTSALVFCRTRGEVDELTATLSSLGYGAAALHGGMTQESRDGVLRRFKQGVLKVLVATDVAARGLHVEKLSHVVNFDLPNSPEPYVHRIGRTGRAGEEGVALSFLEPREQRLLGNIERTTRRKIAIEKVPSGDRLIELRAKSVARLVKESMGGRAEALAPLVATLAEGTSAEMVAAGALLALQKQLYPPKEADDVEFPEYQAKGRKPHPVPGSRPLPGRPMPGGYAARAGASSHRPHGGPPPGPSRRDAGPPAPRPSRRDAEMPAPRPSRRDAGVPAPRPSRRDAASPRRDDVGAPRREAPEARSRPAHAEKRPLGHAAAWLFITLGERAGLRPQDVVGAIANEAGVPSRNIGEIHVGPVGTRVQVPADVAPRIIEALRATTLRGRKFKVDYFRTRGPA